MGQRITTCELQVDVVGNLDSKYVWYQEFINEFFHQLHDCIFTVYYGEAHNILC